MVGFEARPTVHQGISLPKVFNMPKDEKLPARDDVIEQRAFELFTARRAQLGLRGAAEQIAAECYRDAEAFFSVADRVRAGEAPAAKPAGPQLADCCAPNLKPTHPVNMVSQRFGTLERIQEIHTRLQADEKIDSLPEYEWGLSEIHTARTLFPAFVSAN